MLLQEEKERVLSVIFRYQKAYEKIQRVQQSIDQLKTESLALQTNMEALREEEMKVMQDLREKYGEELDANMILEEIKDVR
jgi:hypothetical protein